MRLGLLADPHANIDGLRAALRELRSAEVELVVCAGDVVGYHSAVNETIDELRRSVEYVTMGNHDAMLVGELPAEPRLLRGCGLDYASDVITAENRQWLRGLPRSLLLTVAGRSIAIFHGSPWDPLTEYVYPDDPSFGRFANLDAEVIVLGHTHRQFERRVGGRTVVNPGSCGLPRDGDGAPYAVLDTEGLEIVFGRAEYDRASAMFIVGSDPE